MNTLRTLSGMLALSLWCGGVQGRPAAPAADADRSHYIRDAGGDRVIVFVHGIFEDAIDTWTNSTGKRAYFPQLVADDPDLKGFDVYVAEYPSQRTATPKFTIDDAVSHLEQRLEHDHVFSGHNQVIFVCHSMGGIVAERFMLKDREEAKKVVLMVLYAVPQEGSSLANFGRLLLRGNKQLEALVSRDVNLYLDNLDAEWRKAGFAAAMTCIYETRPTMGFTVVDRRGATRLCREEAAPVNGTHSEVVKPLSREDEPYVILRNALDHQLPGHWVVKPIQVEGPNGERQPFSGGFRDIFLLDHKQFLCGSIYEGGGSGDVGSGFLLHSSDEAAVWRDITHNVVAGKGEFLWGNRPYSWTQVGPINSIAFYKHYRNGSYRPEGWLASASGIYTTDKDEKCTMTNIAECSWHRSSPAPDQPGWYAFFFRLAYVEAFSEVYAVGWQGIAHWSPLAGGDGWEVQLPTHSFEIDGVTEFGGSENREVWAVGHAGRDESGHLGAESPAAVYRLDWPANRWESLPLSELSLVPGPALIDLLIVDRNTVVAVGQGGLIIRGRRGAGTPAWKWQTLPSQTREDLVSIAAGGHAIWAVGGGGVILRSTDQGTSWSKVEVKGLAGQGLSRVRFFGDEHGWILGNNVVLQYATTGQ